MDLISILLAASVPIALLGGYIQRARYVRRDEQGNVVKQGLGIGWQFIRFMVLATGLPLIALLALKGLLSPELITLFASAMGFAFGKSSKDD